MRPNTGYFWIAIVYNVSICISLYCLGMLWMVVNDDLKAFRPMPKFLCVKVRVRRMQLCVWPNSSLYREFSSSVSGRHSESASWLRREPFVS